MASDREKLMELIRQCRDYLWGREIPDVPTEDKLISDFLIANGVTVQKWIPASEPPEKDGRYLCQIRSYVRPRWEYIDVLTYDGYGFKVDGIYTERVTYWRPLPPKEGE